MVYLYVMLRVTHLSVTMPSHASFSNLSGYHFSHHAAELDYVQKIIRAGSTEKVISLLGEKNTGKKTPKEDTELGYRLQPNTHFPFTPPPTKKHAIVPNA